MSAVPEGLTVEEFPGGLRISWWGFSLARLLGLALAAVVLAQFLWVLWLEYERGHVIGPVWIMVALGLGAAWTQLELLVNRTVLELRAGTLSISVGPLPFERKSLHSRQELAQLYVEEHVTVSKDEQRHLSYSYTLSALLCDGHQRKLLAGFEDRVRPLFLKRVIEKRFGITPQPVAGAVE